MARAPIVRERRPVTAAERAVLTEAVDDAELMMIRVLADMETIWNQGGRPAKRRRRRRAAWEANAAFVRWFGVSERMPLMRRTRRRIKRVRSWLANRRVRFIVRPPGSGRCTPTTLAYVIVPRLPLRIHVCPAFFTTDREQRAATVVHELVHQLGFAHAGGITTPAQARAAAINSPRMARRSPENYENLCKEFFP